MSKILFVTAPYYCWGVQVVGTWPPLHLAYMAGAALDAGEEARIYDAIQETFVRADKGGNNPLPAGLRDDRRYLIEKAYRRRTHCRD